MRLYKAGETVKYTLAATRDDEDPAVFSIGYLPYEKYQKYGQMYADALGKENKQEQTIAFAEVCRKQFIENVTEISGVFDSSGEPLTDPLDVVGLLSFEIIQEVTQAMRDPISLNKSQIKNSERDSATHSNEVKKTESPSSVKIVTTTLKTGETARIESD